MTRLFLGYLLDVTWRSFAVLLITSALVVPPVLALGFDRDVAVLIAIVATTCAAFMYAGRFALNLGWLQVAPISRTRLWWMNYFANFYPALLIVVFTCLLIALGSVLPEPPRAAMLADTTSEATTSSHALRFAPFGTSAWPYLLLGLSLLHGVLVISRGPLRNTPARAGKKSYVLGVALLLLFVFPPHPLLQGASFAACMGLVCFLFTRVSVHHIGLPKAVQRRFVRRYGTATLLMTAAGLAAMW